MRIWVIGILGMAQISVATAQSEVAGMGLNLGFSANIPDEPLGLSFFVGGRRWGVYLDRKISSLAPYEPDSLAVISPELAETARLPLLDTDVQTSTINIALVRRLAPAISAYAGLGVRKRVEYREYLDTLGIVSPFGFKDIAYWTEDRRTAKRHISFLGGVLLRLTKTAFGLQVGVESDPKGVTAGVFYRFGEL